MGKKAMVSHLSVPPIPPFFPYLSLLSLLPLLLLFAFYPLPPLLLLCMYAAHRMKCSYGVFTKGSDFSRSWGEWGSVALVLVVIFQKLLSHAAISPHQPPTPPFFPYRILIPSMLQPSLVSQRDVRTENRVGKQSIGCQYFLVKGSSVTKPVLAESRPDLCCGKATPHRANRDSCKHMVMWQEQKKKRKMHYTKMILLSVFFWKTGE